MGYKLLDEITSADIAFESSGKNLTSLFKVSAIALMRIQIENVQDIKQRINREIILEDSNIDSLLFKFLNEIVFLKDKDRFIFNHINLNLRFRNGIYHLKCKLLGDRINKKIKQIVDIKAISMHKFRIKKRGNIYYATIVIDV